MSRIDEQIDALYQVPPGEFTAARTALAKSLTGEHARQVARLKKPSIVPWAINQLYWKARPIYERLVQRGHALRSAQIATLKGRKTDVRGAAEAHRQAITEAVHRTAELASDAGLNPNPEQLAQVFEALSLAAVPPEPAGRLTHVLEPAGFDALSGVTPTARVIDGPPSGSAEATHAKSKPSPGDQAAERQRVRQEQRQRREAEVTLKAAMRTADRARAREQAARQTLERAEADVRVAEQAVVAARNRLSRHRS